MIRTLMIVVGCALAWPSFSLPPSIPDLPPEQARFYRYLAPEQAPQTWQLSWQHHWASGRYRVQGNTLHYADEQGLVAGLSAIAQFAYHGQIPSFHESAPALAWRGLMIDVARNKRSEEWLLRLLDEMAALGLNRLHLHLTDDQGWRIPIPGWPRLTTIGSDNSVRGGDGSGYYDTEFLQQLVARGQTLGITIVPEVDMPGHILSALVSYPELACEGARTTPYQGMRVGFSKLCLTEKWAQSTEFASDVLDELMRIFPSPWIHIGGDEVESERYSDFMHWSAEYLAANGRWMVGWHEVLNSEPLPSNVVVQWWRDQHWPQMAQEQGLALIQSPCDYLYFDHGIDAEQTNVVTWCHPDTGLPLAKVAQMDALATPSLGIEAALWGEFLESDQIADERLWPRLIVAADIGWFGRAPQNWQERVTNYQSWLSERQPN